MTGQTPDRHPQPPAISWTRLIAVTILAAYAFVFIEWLFTITKPSFMRTLGFGKQVEVLLFTAALVTVISLLPILAGAALCRIPRLRKVEVGLLHTAIIIPALITGSMLLLMLDNFTYTLLKFGIVSTTGVMRAVYAIVYIGLIALAYRWLRTEGITAAAWIEARIKPLALAVSMAAVCLVPLLAPVVFGEYAFLTARASTTEASQARPNILLITSDGVNAVNTSAYGYERDTTPNIAALAQTSLVAENAFTNSGNTSGSIIAYLTGKYPSDTRVLYPPDILHGMDAYEHLPGILKANGYYTAQISYPYFVDAYTLNLLDGFDRVNGRSESSGLQLQLRKLMPNDYAYFVYQTANRLADRVRHVFFLKTMTNPYDLITQDPDPIADQHKFDELIRLLETSEQPLFIHLHAMGTHGATFHPEEQVFSNGKDIAAQETWDVDFYDDSILDFDRHVGEVITRLKELAVYDNTIIIIGSDHPEKYDMTQRIPLIIHFPEDEYAGQIASNVQAIDIAPTLLAYMGLDIPQWMSGTSLLTGEPGPRPIFGFGVGSNATLIEGQWQVDPEKIGAPFYQFQIMSVEYCDRWFRINFATQDLTSGQIFGSTQMCSGEQIPTNEQMQAWMVEHMDTYGFDVSSLR